jgi:hypothetical protein
VKRREGCLERCADGGDIAVTAHLCNEASAGAEGTVNTGEEGLVTGRSGDPMEDGVGEDSVKLVMVGERSGIVLLDVEVTLPSCGEHSWRGVGAGEDCTSGG